MTWLLVASMSSSLQVGSKMVTGNIAVAVVAAVVVDPIVAGDVGPTVAVDASLALS